MSKLTSMFWTTDGTGDGIPYPQCFLTRWQRMTWLNDPTTMGIAVGYRGEMRVSNPTGLELDIDGGACMVYGFAGWKDTWQTVFTSPETGIFSMATDNSGVWCAGSAFNGKIYRSTDNGITWAEVYTSPETRIYSIATDCSGIWCAGSGITGRIYRSTDNGLTWAETYNSPELIIYSIATDCNGVWYAGSGNTGRIYRSTDNGITWAEVYPSAQTTILSIATDCNGVWCAGSGNNGKIYRSTNNGATWGEIYDSTEDRLYGMTTDNNGVWCTGSYLNGKIYRSADNGATWAEVYDSPETFISDIATDGAGIWCAGSEPNGKIYRSTDNGITWRETFSSTEGRIYSIATDNAGIWCAGGEPNGRIYRTIDLNHNLTLPLVGNTGWRVVVRIRWDKRTMETVLLESVDGVSDIPEITQDVGVYWEISLAYGTVSTMGVVTVNDNRTFLSSAGEITGDMIANESITPIKIQNRTRKFWCAAVDAYDNTAEPGWNTGTGWGWQFADNINTRGDGAFTVPADFVSDLRVMAIVVSGSDGGHFYIGNAAYYGADGEAWDTHADSFASAAVANPGNEIKAEVAQMSLADAAIGDHIALAFARYGGNAADTATGTLIFMGWIISYTADS